MFNNIKSVYILKLIFNLISEKNKLKLIIHNKQLQTKLEINLKTYKTKSGICRIIEKDGQGEEKSLKTNKIIFKGQYLNGKRNGKGAEYNSKTGKLIFQGGYLNGKRNGQGKEYDEKIKCIFEGEYLNGKRNGKGKEMKNGKIIFEGEYKEGMMWTGKGYNIKGEIIFQINEGNSKHFIEINDKEKKIYEGEYLNGKRNGKGKEFRDDKCIYEGEYLNGERSGKGKLYENNELKYEGEFLNGKRNRKGKELHYKKYYEGIFINDEKNGKFKGYDENNTLIFEGEFKEGKKIGKCMEIDCDTKFEGEYLSNEKKIGKFYRGGELVFEGEVNCYDTRINGYGKEYWSDKLTFEGVYKNGKKTGHFKDYLAAYDEYLIFDGEIKDDIRNGKGKEYLNGELKFEGEYLDGKRWNGKIYNSFNNTVYEIKNGNGIIEEYDNDLLIFKGEIKDGEKYNGRVIEDYFEESCHYTFEGVYINGTKKGKKYAEENLIYDGELDENNLFNGKGIQYYDGEKIFEGEFKDDKKWNGKGKSFTYGDLGKRVLEYEGEF